MAEYILDVPNEEIELFIARTGIEDCSIYGCKIVGEIVRCRDCLFRNMGCELLEFNFPGMEETGFCAWGQRAWPKGCE